MKRFAQALGTSVALALLAVPVAYAGTKAAFNVVVNTSIRDEEGAQGTAHNRTDTVQRIYCRTSADAAGNESVRCLAVSAANVSATCFSTLPAHARSAQSAGNASFIYFTWDVNGVCQSIDVLKAEGAVVPLLAPRPRSLLMKTFLQTLLSQVPGIALGITGGVALTFATLESRVERMLDAKLEAQARQLRGLVGPLDGR
ncbi:hypothetical protein HI113_18530 [Corallococcus exiguus]|uniref:hypothetical protein n=1 Tax=Corallococcus TaxID=83461 RepID=UPI000ED3D877|nr:MULTISPECIES: hypothetical protein [Corallococcus]NNB88415.1 hypothetical protein [Corallococcus exiguus]NNB95896.1 hypothetical protein [Corallococcus exiguus]NPC47627.1 hypothetical protein [Corallococcus exiguus]RKH79115.1 hypothetical protein D7X99_25950 [Corallococcus sp. AB032C]